MRGGGEAARIGQDPGSVGDHRHQPDLNVDDQEKRASGIDQGHRFGSRMGRASRNGFGRTSGPLMWCCGCLPAGLGMPDHRPSAHRGRRARDPAPVRSDRRAREADRTSDIRRGLWSPTAAGWRVMRGRAAAAAPWRPSRAGSPRIRRRARPSAVNGGRSPARRAQPRLRPSGSPKLCGRPETLVRRERRIREAPDASPQAKGAGDPPTPCAVELNEWYHRPGSNGGPPDPQSGQKA